MILCPIPQKVRYAPCYSAKCYIEFLSMVDILNVRDSSVIASDIYTDSDAICNHFGSIFETRSWRFDFSARSHGHVMVWLAGTAQEAGAGGRSGQLVSLFTVHRWDVFLDVDFLHFSM